MMKRILFAAALLTAACSCTKEGAARFEGYYSYKLSGTVSFEAASSSSTSGGLAPDNVTFTILPESGQLNILTEDKKSGSVLMTLNAVGGDVTTITGKAEGNSLLLDDSAKRIHFEISGTPASRNLTLSGTGKRLDDMLIIEFTASGGMDYLGRSYVVTGSDIDCVARLNGR